jgi:3',5'-cyclic AMP phosphodiesterase CpdA
MVRFLHFSDVHLSATPLGWRTRDWFSKRIIGYTNIKVLGRGYRFRHATKLTDAMIASARLGNYDLMVFSGDATRLAFDSEFANAAAHLGVGDPTLPPGFAIPGNHDYYTRTAARSGLFEKHFAPWLQGMRIDENIYPFARKVGQVWFIGVNSCQPRRINYAASGIIGNAQMERLKLLCARLDPGIRVMVTHYPLRDSAGDVERRSHRLLDHREALATARQCGIQLWLHGHIHNPFVLEASGEIPFPVINAGSATQTRRWAHNEYQLDGNHLTMTQHLYDPERSEFVTGDRREFELSEV